MKRSRLRWCPSGECGLTLRSERVWLLNRIQKNKYYCTKCNQEFTKEELLRD